MPSGDVTESYREWAYRFHLEVMEVFRRWACRCHPRVTIDREWTKPELDFNWKRIRINLCAIYLNQRKCLRERIRINR